MSNKGGNIKVLLAEDDSDLLYMVQMLLEEEGLTVYPISNGLDAYSLFLELKPDIAVLDIDMPGIDGLKLCEQIRKKDTRTPIIFTTGLADTVDVKAGFDAGANDYLKKPFDVGELAIRIRYLTKSIATIQHSSDSLYKIGAYAFDSDIYTLSYSGKSQSLSYTESSLLEVLCQDMGQIIPRDKIIDSVWDTRPAIDSRSIDVYISRLRKYLSKDPHINIINCYGKGYRLVVK